MVQLFSLFLPIKIKCKAFHLTALVLLSNLKRSMKTIFSWNEAHQLTIHTEKIQAFPR